MAGNRTMMMALGKLSKKPAASEDEDEEGGAAPAASEDDSEDEDEEEPEEKKKAFLDMCKAIRAGKDDKAYELYQDICEGM